MASTWGLWQFDSNQDFSHKDNFSLNLSKNCQLSGHVACVSSCYVRVPNQFWTNPVESLCSDTCPWQIRIASLSAQCGPSDAGVNNAEQLAMSIILPWPGAYSATVHLWCSLPGSPRWENVGYSYRQSFYEWILPRQWQEENVLSAWRLLVMLLWLEWMRLKEQLEALEMFP